jgi:CDP-diglyceride synthetase
MSKVVSRFLRWRRVWGAVILLSVLSLVIYTESYLYFSVIVATLAIWELLKNFQKLEGNWFLIAMIHCLGIMAINVPMERLAWVLIIGIVFCNDASALIGGKHLNFGIFKKPIFPKTSPNKTWGGFLWGIIGGIVFAFAFNSFFDALFDVSTLVVITIVIELLAVAGDFLESFIKRKGGVKDSGEGMFTERFILPGHGGIYDRFDALNFVLIGIFVGSLF